MLRALKMCVRELLLPTSPLLLLIWEWTALMGLLAINTTSSIHGTRTSHTFVKVVIWVMIFLITSGIAARIVISLLESLGWISRDHE